MGIISASSTTLTYVDTHDYLLENGSELLDNFKQIDNNRIIIGQKVAEDYSYNSGIKLSLDKLYPLSNNFDEIYSFLENFNIQHKYEPSYRSKKISPNCFYVVLHNEHVYHINQILKD
jgi:hypothetical protein